MKVLLISHNPITTYQNMGKTFLSLFSSFKREELCQLYIYPTFPDVDVCDSYYRITDKNVFDSFMHFGKVKGREISINDIDTTKHDFYENKKEESFINGKKTPLKIILRDFMWNHSRWYTRQLTQWLEKQRPTCIFLAPGGAKFIYNIALKISKEFNLPIITYICDEYYFIKKTDGIIDKCRLVLLQSKMRQLMSKTSCIVAISDDINRLYSETFNVYTETIMTGASIPIVDEKSLRNEISGITYLGNLSLDRISSLVQVGKALDLINSSFGTSFKVFLYTRYLNETQKELIDRVKSIKYCGYVVGNDFAEVIRKTDALLHVESFKEIYTERVSHSISTKIADSLSCGGPLIAYAPRNIASMKYLMKEEAALTISNSEELIDKLSSFVFDSRLRKTISENGIKAAKIYHDSRHNSLKVKAICERLSIT